jgi:hypothetical protein
VKALEHLIIQSRSRWRGLRARRGSAGRPARALLRLDDLDEPVAPGPLRFQLAQWEDRITELVQWAGAMPVCVVARAANPLMPDVVRFAHRLECPTSLRTTAAGLPRSRAEELLDRGLDELIIRVAGASDAVQQAVLGESALQALDALQGAVAARMGRGLPLRVVVEIPLTTTGAREVPALFAWARGNGADAVRIAAPFRGLEPGPDVAAALDFASTQRAPFHATPADAVRQMRTLVAGDEPGATRRGGRCPVGGTRVELRGDGAVLSCPFKAGAGSGGLEQAWGGLADHRGSILACERSCVHPDLAC